MSLRSLGEVQSVAISGSTATLVEPVAGKRVRVLGYVAVAGAEGATFLFETDDGTTATPPDLTGAIVLAAGGVVVAPVDGNGWFETADGEGLGLVVSAGAVNGHLTYQIVTA